MSDFILIDGDTVKFDPMLRPIGFVATKPGTLKGSGKPTLKVKKEGRKVCIAGDEEKVSSEECEYTTPIYTNPGKGKFKIASLDSSQKAKIMKSDGNPVLLKGNRFEAKFEVKTAATTLTQPPIRDPIHEYSGTGTFITKNKKWKGT